MISNNNYINNLLTTIIFYVLYSELRNNLQFTILHTPMPSGGPFSPSPNLRLIYFFFTPMGAPPSNSKLLMVPRDYYI